MLVVQCVQEAYVAASLVGVATPLTTVLLAAKASAAAVLPEAAVVILAVPLQDHILIGNQNRRNPISRFRPATRKTETWFRQFQLATGMIKTVSVGNQNDQNLVSVVPVGNQNG
ncbi:hypothetical protein Q3G72_021778 [Acer saccharum]|nr:hypothetical protein Q3G72_021778 [Acer saccharum]